MKKCKINENHRYCNHLSDCPWCEIYNLTGKDPFPAPVKKQSSSTISQNYQWISTKNPTNISKLKGNTQLPSLRTSTKNTLKKSTISISKLGALIVVLSALFLFSNVYSVYKDNFTNSDSNAISTSTTNSVGMDFVLRPVSTYTAAARDIVISGNYAYVADAYNGLVILDISNPTLPIYVGGYYGNGAGIAISGNYAYVAESNNGLVVLDISNPSAPSFVGSFDTEGQVFNVVVSGNYAYISDMPTGFKIVDITNPDSPVLAGEYNSNDGLYDIEVSGNYAYLADNENGLLILDISNPLLPTLKGRYNTNGKAYGVTVSGNHAYVADLYNGLVIVDITNPNEPTLAGEYNKNDCYSLDVVVSGSYAYIADGANGLVVLDITNPNKPKIVGSNYTTGWAHWSSVSGDYVYLSEELENNTGNILILHMEETSAVSDTPKRNQVVSGNALSEPTTEIDIALEENKEKYINSIGMEFLLIPRGDFYMGTDYVNVEMPVHKVTIDKAFYLGEYEVTQKQWIEVMGSNPSTFRGDNNPVETVSWDDIQKFIRKLNEMEGTSKYRLPSEAEWEYACRAGTTTDFSFGTDVSKLEESTWYKDNSGMETHPIGQKKPNSWGLYDMHGNVCEWVKDEWHNDYSEAPIDGSTWEDGSNSLRVVRGGSWFSGTNGCRSANRFSRSPEDNSNIIGFRIVLEQ